MTKCLLTAIRSHNAKTIAWTEGGFGRMALLLTEDLFYWDARGVHDADDLLLWLDAESWSYAYRKAYGMNPPTALRKAFCLADADERRAIIRDLEGLPFLQDAEFDSVEG